MAIAAVLSGNPFRPGSFPLQGADPAQHQEDCSMAQGKTIVTIAAVVVIAALLQVLLVFADCRSTPSRTAVEFTEAYYQFDPSMADLLCGQLLAKEAQDPVGDYLYRSAEDARQRGFELADVKSTLFHVETVTDYKDDKTAEVHLKAVRRQAGNLVFAWVARIFFLGEAHEVKKTLNLVKENGEWKVCGQPFSFSA
jgi:hypothetical protein